MQLSSSKTLVQVFAANDRFSSFLYDIEKKESKSYLV